MLGIATLDAEDNEVFDGEMRRGLVLTQVELSRHESAHQLFLTTFTIGARPAETLQILIRRDDADERADQTQEMVKRRFLLSDVVANDAVSFCDDCPVGVERICLPEFAKIAGYVFLLMGVEYGCIEACSFVVNLTCSERRTRLHSLRKPIHELRGRFAAPVLSLAMRAFLMFLSLVTLAFCVDPC